MSILVYLFLALFVFFVEGGCPNSSQLARRGHCARVYLHNDCGGNPKLLTHNQQVSSPPRGFNDAISSAVVQKECRLTVFKHKSFQGTSRHLFGECHKEKVYAKFSSLKIGWWGHTWNDITSSYKCVCNRRCDNIRSRPKARMPEETTGRY